MRKPVSVHFLLSVTIKTNINLLLLQTQLYLKAENSFIAKNIDQIGIVISVSLIKSVNPKYIYLSN